MSDSSTAVNGSNALCKRCDNDPATLQIRSDPVCQKCFSSYITTKTIKRMETYRTRGSTAKTPKKLLLPLSFGPSSACLLSILDQHLQGQYDRMNRAAYELLVVHIDLYLDDVDRRKSSTLLEKYQARFPRHTYSSSIGLEEALNLDAIDWKTLGISHTPAGPQASNIERMQEIFSSMPSATSRADIISTLLTRLIVDLAMRNGCESVLLGDSTTRLAEKTLTETAKGRGFSLPWQVSDGMSPYGIGFNYPLRDLLKKEIFTYSSLTSPSLTDLILHQSPSPNISASSKLTTIDDLMAQYFESVEENYPSIVANVVRTSSKLKPISGGSSTACGTLGFGIGVDGCCKGLSYGVMASTPMAIDSPIGTNGIGGSVRPLNLPTSGPATAKIADVISLYQPTKHFSRNPTSSGHGKPPNLLSAILSLDFDDEGAQLLTSESDNSLQIYNVKEGKHSKTCLSQKYGVNHAIFGHATGYTIRYLSTHDNSYIRYFEGHEQNVTCLALHPGQDNFLSCSEDNTLRIWDASTKNACGRLNLNGAYLAAWDPSGNVFAVASPTAQTILLYDQRNFDKEPFSTFDMLEACHELPTSSPNQGWNKLEFSNDGKYILLGTTGHSHYLLDAFKGELKTSLRRDRGGSRRLAAGEHAPQDEDLNDQVYTSTGDCCFTSDGRYVISGCRGQDVLVWDTLTPVPEKELWPTHTLPFKGDCAVVAFNPRYNFFATADKEVVFWVPDMSAI
ncbi:hypothetical protein B7494_g1027 [Chlorociboria aeruginascens]|nr:hypothetical protein B7494_g1027 [Chlorociboria aeruginascens]